MQSNRRKAQRHRFFVFARRSNRCGENLVVVHEVMNGGILRCKVSRCVDDRSQSMGITGRKSFPRPDQFLIPDRTKHGYNNGPTASAVPATLQTMLSPDTARLIFLVYNDAQRPAVSIEPKFGEIEPICYRRLRMRLISLRLRESHPPRFTRNAADDRRRSRFSTSFLPKRGLQSSTEHWISRSI